MEDEQMDKENPLRAEGLAAREQWIEEAIAKELTERKDLLPPWRKYPEIPNFSIGWRMGSGEGYLLVFHAWAQRLDQSQLLAYFSRNKPIPIDWLNWVSDYFGFEDDLFSESEDFPGIHWLEEHQLASYAEFQEWHKAFMVEDQGDEADPEEI